jgi:membrane associated rhomboid family serine protease
MFNSIWEDVKREFRTGNMVTRLIIINLAVFVGINLIRVFLYLGNAGQVPAFYSDLVHFFCISSDWKFLLTHPWGIITNMFLHEGFWHILWNMLFLYWFGRIVGDFIGNQRVLPLYIMGGLAGAILFFISANLLPYGGDGVFALGASGAVMAIVVASGVIAPDYIMRLILIGDVKLKYVVAVLVFLDLIALANDINTGGHFAHLGGAAFGGLFVTQLRQGNDLSEPFNRFLAKIQAFFKTTQTPPRPKVVYKNVRFEGKKRKQKEKMSKDERIQQDRVDAILDKIKEKGYDSLSKEEKEYLFNASKKG